MWYRYVNCVVQIYVQQRSEIFDTIPKKYNMTYGNTIIIVDHLIRIDVYGICVIPCRG